MRAYLNDTDNRLTIDARLAFAGHTGRAGQVFEVIPGLSLRFALAAIYSALSEHVQTDEERYALDVRLGLIEVDLEQGVPVRELPDDPRLAANVPTAANDPVAMAALAQFGDS